MQNDKTLRKYTGENLDNFEYGHTFLDTGPKTKSLKEIIDKLNFMKSKNFCSVKDNVKRTRQASLEENIYKRMYLIKNYYPKYTENSTI